MSFEHRDAHAGYTLLETLVALSIVSLFVTIVFSFLTASNFRQDRAMQSLAALEVSQAALDEYLARFPEGASSGSFPGGWNWRVNSTETRPPLPSTVDDRLTVFRIEALAWHESQPALTQTLVSYRTRINN